MLKIAPLILRLVTTITTALELSDTPKPETGFEVFWELPGTRTDTY